MAGKKKEQASQNVERTVISVSLSAEDKMKLKIIAAKQGKTVSGVIHDWIEKEKV